MYPQNQVLLFSMADKCSRHRIPLLNKLVAINHEGRRGQNNKYKRNNSDQSQRNGCNNRDTQTTLQNHSIQAKSGQCALADTAVGGFPPFFVFFILSYLSLLGRRETRRNKCTAEPCKFEFPFLSFLSFLSFFFGFFLLLRFPSSFNLPSRIVTIHNVFLNIVELPALQSSSAVVHN